jgi:hypothetical protein
MTDVTLNNSIDHVWTRYYIWYGEKKDMAAEALDDYVAIYCQSVPSINLQYLCDTRTQYYQWRGILFKLLCDRY